MRKNVLFLMCLMPAMCMAYDESETSAFEIFAWLFSILYFILTVVVMFKIIDMADRLKKVEMKMDKRENHYYYYLMGDKEKAEELLTKEMVQEMVHYVASNEEKEFRMDYWKLRYKEIGCEIPEIFKNVNGVDDFKKLFGKDIEK